MDTATKVYLPDYYRVFERIAGGWLMKPCQFFYRHTLSETNDNDLYLLYGISPQQDAIELFRINGSNLVNLIITEYLQTHTDNDHEPT